MRVLTQSQECDVANIYAQRLESIFKRCETDGTYDALLSADRLRLSRKKICIACDFPRSTIYQNMDVVRSINLKEMELLSRGIIRAERVTLSELDEVELEAKMMSHLDSLKNEISEMHSNFLAIGKRIDDILNEN